MPYYEKLLDEGNPIVSFLYDKDACDDAVTWAAANIIQKKCSKQQLYKNCKNGSWLIWLAETLHVNKKLIGRAVLECVKSNLKYIPKTDTETEKLVQLIEQELNGKKVKDLSGKLRDCIIDVNITSRRHDSVIRAICHMGYNLYTYAMNELENYGVRTKMSQKHANIIRKYIPWSVIEEKFKKLDKRNKKR